jgi:hypothetical protein
MMSGPAVLGYRSSSFNRESLLKPDIHRFCRWVSLSMALLLAPLVALAQDMTYSFFGFAYGSVTNGSETTPLPDLTYFTLSFTTPIAGIRTEPTLTSATSTAPGTAFITLGDRTGTLTDPVTLYLAHEAGSMSRFVSLYVGNGNWLVVHCCNTWQLDQERTNNSLSVLGAPGIDFSTDFGVVRFDAPTFVGFSAKLASAVPEPSSAGLVVFGLPLVFAGAFWRRRMGSSTS